MVPLQDLGRLRWEDSAVRGKLARVLWIAVEADARIEPAARRVGNPLLWSPSHEEERVLREDFEELVGLIASGYVGSLTAHRGRWLQIRPKGADASARTWTVDEDGAPIRAQPRGFYLRRSFTAALLRRSFIVAPAAAPSPARRSPGRSSG